MKYFRVYAIAFLIFSNPVHAKVAAGLAGFLSVIPGLGQLVNGRPLETVGWAGAYFGTAYGLKQPYAAYFIQMYNMYDAYRDAKPEINRYKNHNWFQNYIGAFNPANVLDPIGGPTLALYGAAPGISKYKGGNFTPLKPFGVAMIGWGEEALFRGFLFPAFSDLFGGKFWGALVSSVAFGMIHTQYGAAGKATVGLLGMVFCWQVDNNEYDLRKSIFAHAWIDFFLLPKGVSALEKPPTRENLEDGGVDVGRISYLYEGLGARLNFEF